MALARASLGRRARLNTVRWWTLDNSSQLTASRIDAIAFSLAKSDRYTTTLEFGTKPVDGGGRRRVIGQSRHRIVRNHV